MVPNCISYFYIAVIKVIWGRKGFVWPTGYSPSVKEVKGGTWRQAETEAEALQKCCFLACFPWLSPLLSSTSTTRPRWLRPQGAGPSHTNHQSRKYPPDVTIGQFHGSSSSVEALSSWVILVHADEGHFSKVNRGRWLEGLSYFV